MTLLILKVAADAVGTSQCPDLIQFLANYKIITDA